MRFATWNIMHAEHVKPEGFTDPMRAFQAAISALGADFCGLQEVDYFHPRTQLINQAGFAADSGGYSYWAFAPAFTVVGEKNLNISSRSPQVQTNAHNTTVAAYGIAILSKHPVAQWLHKKLPTALWGGYLTFPIDGVSTRFYARDHSRVALAARFENFIVVNTHLSFVPIFARVQFISLKRWARKLEREFKVPVILMGDFNLSRLTGDWKSTFDGDTFPVWQPERQIDFILTHDGQASDGTIQGFETSDHAALIVELDM